ncbi:MAG: hypothetical protein PHR56_04300 [Dehalococcoidales bacterium]|nr:hypothetical protein [Dehalococcoidales bacterium]
MNDAKVLGKSVIYCLVLLVISGLVLYLCRVALEKLWVSEWGLFSFGLFGALLFFFVMVLFVIHIGEHWDDEEQL